MCQIETTESKRTEKFNEKKNEIKNKDELKCLYEHGNAANLTKRKYDSNDSTKCGTNATQRQKHCEL